MPEPIDDFTEGEEATNVIDRRNQSRKYNTDLWEELKEVYRAIKVRTKPLMRKNTQTGLEEEDKTSTNVAMPDLHVMFRRNVARYTAQPYRLRYIGGSVPYVAEALSALAVQQYDRSREAFHDRRVVAAAEMFGFGYSKCYYDELGFDMQLRKAFVRNGQVVWRDRTAIMKAMGAPPAEIKQAVQELGSEITDQEAVNFIGRTGNDVMIQQKVKRYEGPCVKSVFSGQLYLQPGCLSLFESDYAIEEYQEDDLWIKKMAKLTYEDPDTGKDTLAFDTKALAELVAQDPEPEPMTMGSSLKTLLDEALGRGTIILPKRLRVRRRYDILEQHAMKEDGRMWITWVAEKYREKPIGRMPYAFDMYGHYAYTELVPLPDLISAYGDATPRLLRYLYEMHNRTVAQNFDYVSDLLKKFLLTTEGKRISEPKDRGHFKQVIVEGGPSMIQYLQAPPLPNGAFDREAQIMRMLSMAEPNMTNIDNGTAANPQAGRTATTAVLAAKASDTLTSFKIDGRDLYLRELGQKKLWTNQQSQDSDTPWEIGEKAWSGDLHKMVDENNIPKHALTERNGKVVSVNLDVMEIQDDLQVEPEAQSYLAVDDDLRRGAAMDLEQVALSAPDVVDHRKVVEFHLSTIRGIGDPQSFIIPPQPPPPPIDAVKKNFNLGVTAKFEDLPAAVQTEMLQFVGAGSAPEASAELHARDTVKGVKNLNEAAQAAAAMQEPATQPDPQPGAPGVKPGAAPPAKV